MVIKRHGVGITRWALSARRVDRSVVWPAKVGNNS